MIKPYNYLPSLDLHGIDSEYAKILINDFINDNYKLKEKRVIIIHGNGQGIIKKATQTILKNNKLVKEFKIDNFNNGMTIVDLDIKN